MTDNYHDFHIPVMGTGHSADTAIRVAPLGITSVMSFVDDILLDKLRGYYAEQYRLPYTEIPRREEDGRAKRIKAYLETVKSIVEIKFEKIKQLPFFAKNDKEQYFELLPDECPLKQDYKRLLMLNPGADRDTLADSLVERMRAGAIDVNIMVKLDRANYGVDGTRLPDLFSDAKAALRGFAESSLESSMVFSAGMNQTLFTYLASFRDFYRDAQGKLRKKIILKVSDFRSALIQGKFLAKKGLEIHEFRIESGLNCGGHAFPTKGTMMPTVLQEFKEKREELADTFKPLIKSYYEKQNWPTPEAEDFGESLFSVQGGIGTNGEMRRLMDEYGVDHTGWCTPFLFVPEATCVDATTMELLRLSNAKDFYLSNASPLGVPFNNLRNTGSEKWTKKRKDEHRPGSPCPKGFLVSNTEFSERPICVASSTYQKKKLEQIDNSDIDDSEKRKLSERVMEKTCICDHLGNGVLISLGIVDEKTAPQSICPGPNAAWFKKFYTLKEMVDHIYGRSPSIVPSERPHMFVKEIELYVDYFEKLASETEPDERGVKLLQGVKENIEVGMELCMALARKNPFQDENLASISICVAESAERMEKRFAEFTK
ncbi:MAG: hypothetical protein GXP32_03240 [Kiritimatiellaeota bacterium]|nr:hypothetical protein [Kiritimatiellota bacterium]